MPATEHPVLAAIYDEVERLQTVRAELAEQIEALDVEKAALLESHERIQAVVLAGEVTPPDPKPPEPERPAPDSTKGSGAAPDQEVVAFMRSEGPVAKAAIRRKFGIDEPTTNRIVGRLLERNRIEAVGKRAGTRYRVPTVSAPAWATRPTKREGAEGPPPGRKPNANGKTPTLQGRILSVCATARPTLVGLVAQIGAPQEEVEAALGTLIREGEIRDRRKGGEITYAAV